MKTIDAKIIGARLRDLRGEKPQKEVADAAGVTAMAVCQYEAGTRVPSDQVKIALAEYFGRTVENIFFTF